MNDYGSRSEISPTERAATRPVVPVPAVQIISARTAPDLGDEGRSTVPPPGNDTATLDDEVAGAAEYARVHARIAVILSDLRSSANSATVGGAEGEIQDMMPSRVVLVPLPPASKEAVEHAAQLAKRIVRDAFNAHSAQAHVKRGTVDQVLSAGA